MCIKFNANIDHDIKFDDDIKFDASSLFMGDHKTRHENVLSASNTSHCSYGPCHVTVQEIAEMFLGT